MKTIALGLFAAASLSTAFADTVAANALVTCNPSTCVSADGLHHVSANGNASGTLDSPNFSLSLSISTDAMGGGSSGVPVSGGSLAISSLVTLDFDVQTIGSGPGIVTFQYGGGSDGSGGGGGLASIELLGMSASCMRIICDGMQSAGVTLGEPFEISLSGNASAGCFGIIACTDGGVDFEALITAKDQIGAQVPLAFVIPVAIPEPGTTSLTLCALSLCWRYFRRRDVNHRISHRWRGSAPTGNLWSCPSYAHGFCPFTCGGRSGIYRSVGR